MSGIDSARDEKWSEWLTWHGEKKCPIDSDCTVEFVTKGMGSGKTNNPKGLMWVQAGTQADIIAYRYKIKEPESDMHPDLEWLATNVSEWVSKENLSMAKKSPIGAEFYDPEYLPCDDGYTMAQWLQARKDLGLIMSDEEEAMPAEERRNKYQREIKPGIWVDVYDVLQAWSVGNPALQHLIKKALQPGERGHKDKAQDMDDIVASSLRAKELESNNA